MKVIAKVVGAVHTAMSIEDSKVGRFFPIGGVFRFGEVKDDGNSIFIVLPYGSLVGRGRIGSDGAMSIFRMFGRLEIADRHKHFRQHGMIIFMGFNASFFKMECFRLYENLFSNNFINLLDGGFRFRARLVFVMIIFDI